MRSSPARVLRLPIEALVVCLLVLGACAVATPRPPIPSSTTASLAEGRGYVVVHVDTNTVVDELHAGRELIGQALPAGQHIWLIELPAGRHAWTGVRITFRDHAKTYRPEQFVGLNEREFEFDVVEGRINYPGELVIRTDPKSYRFAVHRGRAGWVWNISIRNRNHSAMAIRRLAKTFDGLLASHPIRYAGTSGDGFLDYYSRERGRLAKAGGDDAK